MYAKLLVHTCRATGAAATARAVVIRFGQRAPSRMLGTYLHTFVPLYSSHFLIVLYLLNGVRVHTNANGVQKPEGNDITSGTKEYKRSRHENKGVQTEYKNRWEPTSRAVQTENKRSTNRLQKNTSEHKRFGMFRKDFQASTVSCKPIGQSVSSFCRR